MAGTGHIICPVCGETSVFDGPTAKAAVVCERCGSSFDERDATVVDSGTALRSLGETGRATESLADTQSTDEVLADVPGYEVLEFVARGGMGVVLKARHTVLDRLAAVKLPLAERLESAHSRERFLREARAAAHLRHPHICPIYEVGGTDARPFIAMAFIEGETLRDWAKANPPSPRRAAEMMSLLARAVGYAHEHGVVHRDIKPTNVMVDAETDEPVLTDFGLAKELTAEGPQMTHAGSVVGTPAYMAPEQAAGDTDAVGPATDVYALGAVLYELLCGRPPFLGNKVEILYRVQVAAPMAPRKLNPRVHRDLETICLKALAKVREERYASAVALAEDLERFSAGEPILARRAPWPARVWRTVRRRRRGVAAAAVVAAVVGLAAWLTLGARTAGRVAELRQEIQAGMAAEDWTASHLELVEARVGELERLDPALGAEARATVHERFEGRIRDSLRRSVLDGSDVAAIEERIELLGSRAPELVPGLRKALDERLRRWQPLFELKAPFDGLQAVFGSGASAVVSGEVLRRSGKAAEGLLTRVRCRGNVQLEAECSASWEGAHRVGLALNARAGGKGRPARGYTFEVRAMAPPRAPGEQRAAAEEREGPISFAEARGGGGRARLVILRDGVVLRSRFEAMGSIAEGPVHLTAGRDGDEVLFQVNDLPPLRFRDAFAIVGENAGVFGLVWPESVELRRVRASQQALAVAPSALERGDALYSSGSTAEALAFYRQEAIGGGEAAFRREARYKEAVCLVGLQRAGEAVGIFEELTVAGDERWSPLGACQLWLIRVRQGRWDEAEALYSRLAARYRFEELAALIPEGDRWRIITAYERNTVTVNLLIHNPHLVRDAERAYAVGTLLTGGSWRSDWVLLRAYHAAGQLDRGIRLGQKMSASWLPTGYGAVMRCPELCWMLRCRGEHKRALRTLDGALFSRPGVFRKHGDRVLFVERARIHIAMEEWDEAEADLDVYLDSIAGRRMDYGVYWGLAEAMLVRGFLCERRGDREGALAAWRRGCREASPDGKGSRSLVEHTSNGTSMYHFAVLASLSGELSQSDIDVLMRRLTESAQPGTMGAMIGAMRPPPSVYAALRGMWRTPRGRVFARKVAFRQVPFAEFVRVPAQLLVFEVLRLGAFGGKLSGEQDALVWDLAGDAYAATVVEGTVKAPHLLALMTTWKGFTNVLGWASVAPMMKPALRGPVAYVLGHRYLGLKRAQDAAAFFRTAVADAPAGSPVRRLAEEELERLGGK